MDRVQAQLGEQMSSIASDWYERLVPLCDQGNALAEARDYENAYAKFSAALALIPEPLPEHDASTWVLTAIGDMLFQLGRFQEARDILSHAMWCPNAIGNPFIHLRLGQAQLELGNEHRAADELARAFLLEGKELFDGEDPKYLRFVLERLKPPPGGWD